MLHSRRCLLILTLLQHVTCASLMARSTGLEAYENHAETDFNEPRCRVFNEKV